MIITLGALGGYFYVKTSGQDVSHIGWLPLAALMGYVLCFSLGFGPIPWLMMGEILPAKIRGSAASVATGFNWSCTFIVTKAFADLIGKIHENILVTQAEDSILFFYFRCNWSERLFLVLRYYLCHWTGICDYVRARNSRQKSRGY